MTSHEPMVFFGRIPPDLCTFSVLQPSLKIPPIVILWLFCLRWDLSKIFIFHSKFKCYLFKNSYPDSTDPLLSHSRPKLHPP